MNTRLVSAGRLLLFSTAAILIFASTWCDNSYAYKIHAEKDTVFVHAKRGFTGQPSDLTVISSREGEDTATLLKQGWDTIRVSLSGDSEFAWGGTWETQPIPFLGDRGLYLEYSPTSLAPSTAIVTVVGDSNTIQIVVIGIPDTNYQCLRISSATPPSIPEGGSGLATDTIFNLTDSAIVLDSVNITSGDTNVFSMSSPSFPQTIAPHANILLSMVATIPEPALTTYYSVGLHFSDHGTSADGVPCTTASYFASASVLIPWDTLLLELPTTASDTLNLDVHAATTGHYLVFHNATAKSIYLADAQITDTTHYTRFQIPFGPHCARPSFSRNSFCFDDSLGTGAWSDTSQILMQVPDSGMYPIDLSVHYIDALDTQHYTILAHYILPPNEAVRMTPAIPAVEFALNPNPARGEVTVSLPDGVNSTIEIYDLLGRFVIRRQASGSFVWNGESSSGAFVPDGPYIVRVREVNALGQVATASKRLMFMR